MDINVGTLISAVLPVQLSEDWWDIKNIIKNINYLYISIYNGVSSKYKWILKLSIITYYAVTVYVYR